MKLKFKQQAYQTHAVDAVVKCFAGQSYQAGVSLKLVSGGRQRTLGDTVFGNAPIQLSPFQLLENIKTVQRQQNLPVSTALSASKVCPINLDVEMETGTLKWPPPSRQFSIEFKMVA